METLFIGKNIIFLPHTDSTNSYATHLLKNVNPPEGTVVHTRHQTHGRGMTGNSWNSDASSNMAVSIILKPTFLNVNRAFCLYQVTALACYDTLAELLGDSQFDIKIKWPNDILVNRQKIAGILIENSVSRDRFNWSVAGVGVNLNQESFAGLTQATSLKLLTGQDVEIENVMERFCRHLEKHYLLLQSGKYERIAENYLSRLYGLNQVVAVEVEGIVKSLRVKGVSQHGLLMLQEQDGAELEKDVKELKWIF